MKLTDTKIRQSKPKDKPFKLADGGGLYLQIQPKGGKYWRLAYRYAEKQKTLALGIYPHLSLADSRIKRDEAKGYLANGIDPSNMMSQKVRKLAEVESTENSFEAIAREWHEQKKGGWSANHAKRVLVSLEKEVFPDIGNLPILNITAPQVLAILRRIEKRDALDVAKRMLQRCRAVFKYAIQTGRVLNNPVTDLEGALSTRKVKHRLALPQAGLPEFFKKIKNFPGTKLTQLALNLIILTIVRTNELRGAKWTEFDFDNAEWRIPAERMKMRKEHIVPLSDQAIDVLNELKTISGKHDLVFPSRTTWKKTMSENTMLFALYRMGYHGEATVHGFRATASTILNENNFKPDVVERQLAHVERNKVRAAYNRAEYLDDRKQMMQWWADFIDSQ